MYEHFEQLDDRKSEKFVLFLTLENLGGMLVLAGPIYVISTAWPLLIRLVVLALAVALGVGMTLDWHGLPIYRRLLCRIQGVIWRVLRGGVLLPASVPRSHDQAQQSIATLVLTRSRMVTRVPGQIGFQRAMVAQPTPIAPLSGGAVALPAPDVVIPAPAALLRDPAMADIDPAFADVDDHGPTRDASQEWAYGMRNAAVHSIAAADAAPPSGDWQGGGWMYPATTEPINELTNDPVS